MPTNSDTYKSLYRSKAAGNRSEGTLLAVYPSSVRRQQKWNTLKT
jgi:hypothetical protein